MHFSVMGRITIPKIVCNSKQPNLSNLFIYNTTTHLVTLLRRFDCMIASHVDVHSSRTPDSRCVTEP